MSGSMRTISTTAMRGHNISRHGGIWSTGSLWPRICVGNTPRWPRADATANSAAYQCHVREAASPCCLSLPSCLPSFHFVCVTKSHVRLLPYMFVQSACRYGRFIHAITMYDTEVFYG